MAPPFPFEALLVFGSMSVMLLAGVVLRAKVGFIQRFLFPSCLVGGLLGMVVINSGLTGLSPGSFETFAFHLFNISFISIGLTKGSEQEGGAGAANREIGKGASWMALMQGITFPLQAIVGGAVVLAFGAFGSKLFPTFGFLCPLGFNEGPGQALSFGKVWEGQGFEHAAGIGLTFATIGFFFSFFIGVPLANWGLRRGLAVHGAAELPRDLVTGITGPSDARESAGELTVHSGNVDNLAFQAALVGLVYLLTYFLVKGLGMIVGGDTPKMFWGFFFFFGLFVALILKWAMDRAGVGYLVDPGVQRRLTGWSVDFLIVATVTAIQLTVVWRYLLPIALISLISGAGTVFVILFFGRRTQSLGLERTLAIYGTCTGTVSSGLLLLRIVDPNFKTTAAMELGLMNVIVVPIILAALMLVQTPIWYHWHLIIPLLIFAAIAAASLIILRVARLWGEKKF